MRGKRGRYREPATPAGNIPAYAGKTLHCMTNEQVEEEHPRVCGENPAKAPYCRRSRGTSPRMRGKRKANPRKVSLMRNIPAYAGKTSCIRPCRSFMAEHPRVCGENAAGLAPKATGRGTSPRMRGKPTPTGMVRKIKRNIPAYAGKTFRCGLMTFGCAEHPRVCGENKSGAVLNTSGAGTSPRMRGKHHRGGNNPIMGRNIPAYAGKTFLIWSLATFWAEHPRVCGENKSGAVLNTSGAGTSPRMRGKPRWSLSPPEKLRNIPAYAGKTVVRVDSKRSSKEHPRVCGENSMPVAPSSACCGTSPRMRGKLDETSHGVEDPGNIPAYAGKTESGRVASQCW